MADVSLAGKDVAPPSIEDYLTGVNASDTNAIVRFAMMAIRGAVFNVKDEKYGAVGDGVSNDTTAIQLAIDDAEANLGGIVYFPVGQYLIDDTLLIDSNGVLLLGVSSAGNFDNFGTDPDFGTVIRWDGADDVPMVKFTAISGAGNYPLSHVGMQNITLDCQGGADIGLQLLSVRDSLFEHLYIWNPIDRCLDMNVVATLATSRGTQANLFRNVILRARNVGGEDAHGLVMDGDGTANCSYNSFINLQCQHKNGDAYHLIDTDSNTFYNVLTNRPDGTGVGLSLGASNTPNQLNSRNNTFYALDPGAGGVKAIATGFTNPSKHNAIYGYNMENSAPLPVVEAGATLFVYHNSGEIYRNGRAVAGSARISTFIEEEFDRGGTSTQGIGRLGWQLVSSTWSWIAGVLDHPGVGRITSTVGVYGGIHLRGGPTIGYFDADEDFDIFAIIQLSQTDTDTTLRIGVGNDASANPPSNGIYIEKVAADTQWFGVCRSGGVQTPRTAALITSDTSWHRIRIRRINTTTIGFTIDNLAEVTLATNVPTGDLQPLIMLGSASGTKTLNIDWFSMAITGLDR